jgi:Cytochrome P460
MIGVSIAQRAMAVLAAAGIALALSACAGGGGGPAGAATTSARGSRAVSSGSAAPAPPRTLPGLPADIAGFADWDTLNADPIPPDSAQTRRVGFDAHRGTKEVYIRPSGAEAPFPDGTIVVKAARDGDFLRLVAIMRKISGSDPEHGDWRFVEYQRASAGDAFTTGAGLTGATCWSCHSIARETDWIFTRRDRGAG